MVAQYAKEAIVSDGKHSIVSFVTEPDFTKTLSLKRLSKIAVMMYFSRYPNKSPALTQCPLREISNQRFVKQRLMISVHVGKELSTH